MGTQSCYLCGSNEHYVRSGKVRDNPKIGVLECAACGLVYLESLDHIKQGHYEKSGMHDGALDIQKWLNESQLDDERRYQFVKQKITNKTVLDFGCGIGGFIKMAEASATRVVGVELEQALQSSFKQRGLKVFQSLPDVPKDKNKWDIITAFHVIEHLRDPVNCLSQLSELLSDCGEIIMEVPNSNDVLLTLYENKAFQNFTYWSQHLFLFNSSNIVALAKKAKLKLNWVKHIQRYPLSSHLYWLSQGKPRGHKEWSFMDNCNLEREYESQLASIGKTDTIIAGLSK